MTATQANRHPVSAVKAALAASKKHPNWYFFPINAGTKNEGMPSNNLNDGVRPPGATNNRNKIAQWHPASNVGIAPHASRLTFMDVDVKDGKTGVETFRALIAKHGPLPRTLTVQTPSLGLHYWFKETAEVQHRFRKNAFGPGIDCPQYVLIPGSIFDGRGYVIIDKSPIAGAPAWFAEYLAPKIGDNREADQTPAVDLDTPDIIRRAIYHLKHDAKPSIQFKNGEFTLLMVAATLKDMGVSKDKAIELLAEHYNVEGKCDPLWSVGEGPTADRLDVKVENAWAYLRQTQPGAHSARAAFGDDSVDAAALKALARWWEEFDARPRPLSKLTPITDGMVETGKRTRGVDPLPIVREVP